MAEFFDFIIGFLTCSVIVMIAGWRLSAKKKQAVAKADALPSARQSCSHQFTIIAAQPLKHTFDVVAVAHTITLERCRMCGDHKTVTYAGEWTLEQFLQTDNEIAVLERMMK